MQLLLISSSIVHGYGFLDHAEADIRALLGKRRNVAFVPFAQHDVGTYSGRVRVRLAEMGFDVTQVHGPEEIEAADAIYIGGGNTFRLLAQMYETGIVDLIRERVRGGIPYFSASAGTNVATPSIRTTNDMPIVYPPTFDALGLIPFQINPHYLDPDPSSTHKGETREDRIREFHEENTTPVLGLREGSMLRVEDDVVTLIGDKPARIFTRGETPYELETGSRVEL
ncbi:MAG TPA: dipeptidase PepE [Thermoanaerobaculia bacterium]|nr:dipeptidase PepE [Thermoanaerobaculia bacterium]